MSKAGNTLLAENELKDVERTLGALGSANGIGFFRNPLDELPR